MDVFSLLKFWQHAGVGDPGDLDITSDDGSFFDLVFTSPNNLHSPTAVFFNDNNKRKVLPLDSRSPFRVLKLGFQKKTKSEIEEVTIGSLLKSDNSLASSETPSPSPSKRFSKDVIHKYLNLIKPLYTKVSGRSNQNKHLCKSRSSSAGKLTPSPAARSYDSALQQDGIQSAILHCKRSYNSPSHFGCDVLSRSGSAPSQGRPRISLSIDEEKRSSI